MAILMIILLFTFIVIFLFSSQKFSPIPYFPTQKADVPQIIKAFNLKCNQIIFDLGAGDGIVIFSAASQAYKQKLNTQFVGIDINPILVFIMIIRRFFHPNKKNIKIVYGNIFTMNYKLLISNTSLLTFYLYISPWHMKKTILNIKKQISKFKIISYMYPFSKNIASNTREIKAKNSIFIYDFKNV